MNVNDVRVGSGGNGGDGARIPSEAILVTMCAPCASCKAVKSSCLLCRQELKQNVGKPIAIGDVEPMLIRGRLCCQLE